MDVILLQKVDNLGTLGDKVSVKSGYARNFLLPTGRAVLANGANLAAFEARRAELEKEAAEALAAAEARKTQIENLTLTVTCKAGDEGRLFGSVGTPDISHAAHDAGVPIEKREVRLPSGPFRVAGEYGVDIHLHTDVNATLKLVIVPEA